LRALGIDFGTTNSAIALAASDDAPRLVRFPSHLPPEDPRGAETSTFRSVLYFDPHEPDRRGRPTAFAGPEAIARYLRGDGSGRLVQSLKSHLASRTFTKTSVFGRAYSLEDLVASFLLKLRAEAEARVGPLGGRAVVGRPVRFVGSESDEDDAFAERRLRAAFAQAGFDDVAFEAEPIAAAAHYERGLDHDELVLVADFGGGTSDFCLVRVGPSRRRERAAHGGRDDVLATSGVGLAGDAFDAAIVEHEIAPALGQGSRFLPQMATPEDIASGRTIAVPSWIYGKLRKWHHLSFLKTKETLSLLDDLRKQSKTPDAIAALIHLVEADLGFHLYRAVEGTKVALSSRAEADLHFVDEPVEVQRSIARGDFEQWIDPSLTAIEAAVDRALAAAGVSAKDVDRVFTTGGTSLVPAVHACFARRFGEERVRSGDALTSVALGLAQRASERA
jgi:hypothetical chaperone protein